MQQHLTPLQIEDLIARRAEPGQLVTLARHLSECETCRAAVWEPARTAERASQLRSMLAGEEIAGPRWRLFDWFNQLKPLRLAVAGGAIALLIAAGWWLSKTARTPQPESRIAVAQSPSPAPLIEQGVRQAEQPPVALLIELNDNNQRVGLDQSGKLIGLPELPEELSLAVKQALMKQKLETSAGLSAELKALRGRPATLMSSGAESESFKLTSPVGVIIATDRPEFRWLPLTGAQSYTVTLLDLGFNVVETSQPLSQNRWRLPRALKRGQTYVWQVSAAVGDKAVTSSSASAAEARFKIISAEQSSRLQRLRSQYPESHLVLGTLYAQAGLLAEAEREFQALLKSNPQSTVARRLLNQTRTPPGAR